MGPILKELKEHAPFTLIGALSGIVVLVFFYNLPRETAFNVFYVLHPLHVLLSALVTASLYSNYRCGVDTKNCNLPVLILVGYAGAIGIATLSDSLIPYLGEVLLGMEYREPHIGFIEKWWLVNPLAAIGIAIAYFRPRTKFPHAGHVLISTWASLFHIIMARGKPITLLVGTGIFIFLFLAVWAPCCISDIVFPLLFVKNKREQPSH